MPSDFALVTRGYSIQIDVLCPIDRSWLTKCEIQSLRRKKTPIVKAVESQTKLS